MRFVPLQPCKNVGALRLQHLLVETTGSVTCPLECRIDVELASNEHEVLSSERRIASHIGPSRRGEAEHRPESTPGRPKEPQNDQIKAEWTRKSEIPAGSGGL